jgi:hypothetical protein
MWVPFCLSKDVQVDPVRLPGIEPGTAILAAAEKYLPSEAWHSFSIPTLASMGVH